MVERATAKSKPVINNEQNKQNITKKEKKKKKIDTNKDNRFKKQNKKKKGLVLFRVFQYF